MTTELTADTTTEQRDALVGRLFEASIGALDIFTVYIGDRLGFYRALAVGGATTSTALAARTGTHDRYVREWLEQQAATGILTVEDPAAAPTERRFAAPGPQRSDEAADEASFHHEEQGRGCESR